MVGPVCPMPRRADEPISHFGARLLRFVLETEITGTLSLEELDLVSQAAGLAVTNLPAKLSPTDTKLLARLVDISARVTAVMAALRAKEIGSAGIQVVEPLPKSGESEPTLGAKLRAPIPVLPSPGVELSIPGSRAEFSF